MTGPPVDGRYRVRFRRLDRSRPIRSTLLVLAALLLLGGFLVWLMLPSHWPSNEAGTVIKVASIVMTVTTGVIGVFAFLNLATLCRATLLARDPIPVRAEPGRRVAFVTTIVPSAEPIKLVVPTLEAALQIRYEGEIDVWLLDEGNDPADEGDLRSPRGEPLQPARGRLLEHPLRTVQDEEQARQLERLA